VVGLGPSGIGAALTLTRLGMTSGLICLDQGPASGIRKCSVLSNGVCERDTPCQMICGFGGSSLLSGGKVSDFPAGSGLARVLGDTDEAMRKVKEAINMLRAFVPLTAPDMEQVKLDAVREMFREKGFEYKHFDSYRFSHEALRRAYERVHSDLRSTGAAVLLNAKLIDIDQRKHGFRLTVKQDGTEFMIDTEYLIVGVGRSGRSMLERMSIPLDLGRTANRLDTGVRLEFPTHFLPSEAWYHGDLKLLFKNARTFCVCKDGSVAPYIVDGVFFTEGRFSLENSSGFSNLGVVRRYEPSERNKMLLEDIRERSIQQRNGRLVCQRLTEYFDCTEMVLKTSTSEQDSGSFCVWGDVNGVFPEPVSTDVREAVMYFAHRLLPMQQWEQVKVFAPEVDYGGILLPVKPDFSIRPRLYIIGDCVGQFRGIAQAFCSGVICAEGLMGQL